MKNLLTSLCICAILAPSSSQAQMNLVNHLFTEGIYNGKNLVVKNAYGQNGMGYCVTSVYVNGNLTKDGINADIFQVNLEAAGVKKGENVQVDIMYQMMCTTRPAPLLMNPGALLKPNTKEGSIILEGKFLAQNIFINNPIIPETKSGSVKEVLVNGKTIATNINSMLFEIDLLKEGIALDSNVKIEIKYQKAYDPFILNPEALGPL
jgi:hypothetical protein